AQDLGRRQRLGHELRGVLVPEHDVDLLAVELAHDRLDPSATLADRGRLGVDADLAALYGDLGTAPRLAGDPADHDRAVVDLGNLPLPDAAQGVCDQGAVHPD